MSELHNRKKSISELKKPVIKTIPSWITISKKEVEDHIIKLSKKGETSSTIGMILRDVYGIPDVKTFTEKNITQILAENGLKPRIPEDIRNLMKKAVNLSEHLESNPKDLHNKRALQLIESKIRRLEKYYKRNKVLPETWKYSLQDTKIMIT